MELGKLEIHMDFNLDKDRLVCIKLFESGIKILQCKGCMGWILSDIYEIEQSTYCSYKPDRRVSFFLR